ncbi:MAG: N-acetylmuramoyl-L-alanine amidase [Actinomycetia bacterium]|nr:N-acetylmuramoyl-L-alanine amidase [Actinomycetes bacterium]
MGEGSASSETPSSLDDATATPSGSTTSEVQIELAPLDALGPLPPALITPSGVLVPVVGADDDGGYLITTPCGNEASIAWGQPLRHADVVLDAGHGGDERGALGPSDESEAELNLDIARRTATTLEREGISVALSRTGDYRIPISLRAAIADRLEAELFVSIHHNSPTPTPGPTNGPGSEVYIQNNSPESRRLGGLVYEEIVRTLSQFDADWASRGDAGVLSVVNEAGEDAYGINRYPTTPSVLAELAYISNPTEALVLSTDEYRQAAANALTVAIIRYLDTDDAGSGFVDQPRLEPPSGATGGSDGCVDPSLE